MNRTLERQVEELSRLNKLKTDLLAITSHDLRSPLNGILATADLLINDPDINDGHREYIGLITSSGEQLLKLIGELLDLAKIEAQQDSIQKTPLAVIKLIESLLPQMQQQASKKKVDITFKNEFPGAPPTLVGDWSGLSRVFTNLLSNALKFTRQNGSIKITAIPGKSGELTVSVADTGIGIPKDNLPKLFEKYSEASRPGTDGEASTGLGLSIVKKIIERHDGRIDVQSEEGKGTTMSVHLPMQPKA